MLQEILGPGHPIFFAQFAQAAVSCAQVVAFLEGHKVQFRQRTGRCRFGELKRVQNHRKAELAKDRFFFFFLGVSMRSFCPFGSGMLSLIISRGRQSLEQRTFLKLPGYLPTEDV